MGLLSHEQPVAHEVVKGDPRIDGPYLDDHNAAYEDARRNARLNSQQVQQADEDETPVGETPEGETPEEETPEGDGNDSSGADGNDE